MIKSLLEQYVTARMSQYGAMEVETPIMYDFNHPSLANYMNRFPARQYVLKSEDKELFLRFAACFGQFLMMHDAQFSYKQMPLKLYELTRYSFRREKSGEVCGLKRLRAFTMPDCHAFCADLPQAKKEFKTRFNLCFEVLNDIGLIEGRLRSRHTLHEGLLRRKQRLHRRTGQEPLANPCWRKCGLNASSTSGLKWDAELRRQPRQSSSAQSTDQIDVENAKRYEITFVDEKGEKQYPLILHCSPSGAIER